MRVEKIGPNKEATLYLGDCIETMNDIQENSVDSIVTDPPYGLSFMGKNWDHGVPGQPFWEAVFRVAKPGAHLLAFGGTRTFHRLAVAIEDAGWEIRDTVMWVYGSGFPKSHNVSKAIDKEAGAERKIVGKSVRHGGGSSNIFPERGSGPITSPATEAAKKWEGWGTALKPSIEPIIYARKPINSIPYSDIAQAELNVGGLICLLLSHANNAELFLQSILRGCGEGSGFALLNAAALRGLNNEDLLEKTGMSKLPEMVKTILNTAELWNNILDAILKNQNTFTTETASSLITALRIFNSSTLQIIQENITPEGYSRLGQWLNVNIADNNLSGESKTYNLETFVHEIVMLLTERSDANIVEEHFMQAVNAANIALKDATTSLGEKIVPDFRPIIVARKPLEGTVAANVQEHGTGALNIDGCRIDINSEVDDPRLGGEGSWKTDKAAKKVYEGGYIGDKVESSTKGRFPANLIHDGSDEVVQLFPVTTSHGGGTASYGGLFGNGKEATDDNSMPKFAGDTGSSARFFYCAKASRRDRDSGLTTPEQPSGIKNRSGRGYSEKDPYRKVMRRNTHPTVKPTALMSYLCRLVTQPGGVVLDPFMGSGSTGKAAVFEGFRFIGIELEEEYFDIAYERIKDTYKHPQLF